MDDGQDRPRPAAILSDGAWAAPAHITAASNPTASGDHPSLAEPVDRRRQSRRPVARPPTGENWCRPMTTGQSFRRRPTNCLRSTSTASNEILCHGADRPREERLQGRCAPQRKILPRALIGSSSAPPRSGRIQPDRFRLLLLVIRPARPTLAEVPLADLSLTATIPWACTRAVWFVSMNRV